MLVPAGCPGATRSVPVCPDDRVLRGRLHHGDRYLGESGTRSVQRRGRVSRVTHSRAVHILLYAEEKTKFIKFNIINVYIIKFVGKLEQDGG